ncbi:unnamed protein product [Adineta steineri]|uniref:Uncharacterized protein n=1 Tax=Adineta steineri TaxID=433720 RepID=A0A814MDU8_9BILA|nr:unnamed protein product [Adineta steineri]CAF1077051.1 unnamed protein product [Adineta steineri]
MAESCPRPKFAKIVLGIGCFFLGVTVVCFLAGGPLYLQEYNKMRFYVKDSCRVRSAGYDRNDKCPGESGTKSRIYRVCYIAVWHVEFGPNRIFKATIRSDRHGSYQSVDSTSEKYKAGSSYPCWYNSKKPSQVTWYGPVTIYSFILLLIGAISIPFAIIFLIAFCRLRTRADL